MLLIDNREKETKFPEIIRCKGINFEFTDLECGDYVFPGRFIMKRYGHNFVPSLNDETLFSVAKKLKHHSDQGFIMVDAAYFKHENDWRIVISEAISALSLEYRLPVLTFDGDDFFVLLVESMIKRSAEKFDTKEPARLAQMERDRAFREKDIDHLRKLVGIGRIRAGRLLDHYRTRAAISSVSLDDLTVLVGPEAAGSIHENREWVRMPLL